MISPICSGNRENRCPYSSQIEGLARIATSTFQVHDLKEVFQTALQIMAETMGYQVGYIAMKEVEGERVLVHHAFGLSEEQVKRASYRLGEGVTGEVVSTGKSLILERIHEDGRFLNRTGVLDGFIDGRPGVLCVPIPGEGTAIGAVAGIRVPSPGHPLGEDLQLFTVIAGMIARHVDVERLRAQDNLIRAENERLSRAVRDQFHPPGLVGRSHGIQEICALVARIAPTPTTVLILGESGVGKEVVARSLHENSPRGKGPFVQFNCAALPESLAESELFGHEAGAFTGAVGRKPGRFERASGGTLFLDEVGELTLPVQAKLLRVLQEKEFERVGGSAVIKADVRILAATNQDLQAMIKAGKFREDLYYRLNIFPLVIPPLRERKTDIPLLANHFIEKFARRQDKAVRRISTQAIDMLMSYHWPGNVRELENTMERAVIMSDGGVIQAVDLPPTLQTPQSSGTIEHGSLTDRLDTYEKEIIIDAIKETSGNLSKAAKRLGLTERIMGLRIRKFKINYRAFRYEGTEPQAT